MAIPVRVHMRNGRSALTHAITTFPNDLGPNHMMMVFRKYEYRTPGTIQLNSVQNLSAAGTASATSVNAISLPIPVNLQDQNEARIGRFDLNYLGDKIAGGFADVKNGVSVTDNLSRIYSSLTKADGGAMADAFRKGESADLIGDAQYLLKSFGSTVSKSVSIGTGKVANPKAALAYDGHELKNHSFTWTFAPRSEEESFNLRNIINFIKHNQLPNTGGIVDDMMYLQYPCIVDIYLIGVDENFFYKFKPCMIRSFNANYSGQNAVALLRGGRPVSINIEMNLMEMDIHYAHEYTGNGIGDTNVLPGGGEGGSD